MMNGESGGSRNYGFRQWVSGDLRFTIDFLYDSKTVLSSVNPCHTDGVFEKTKPIYLVLRIV